VLAETTAVVMAAGCANGGNDAGGSTPTSQASAAAGNSGNDNTTEVCAAVESSVRVAMTEIAPLMAKAVQAAMANDKAAGAAAVQAAIPAYEAWATALRTEATRATNAELKAALTAMESELGKLTAVMATANAIDSIDVETTEFVNATKTIEQVCNFKFAAIGPS
jgi:hypothetical protein